MLPVSVTARDHLSFGLSLHGVLRRLLLGYWAGIAQRGL